MTRQEAAERLVVLLNELGAAGVSIEMADEEASEGLRLSGHGDPWNGIYVRPTNAACTTWEVG